MPIEQLRTFLIIGWCLVAFMLWNAWQEDFGPKPPAPVGATAPQPGEGTSENSTVPSAPASAAPAAPGAATSAAAASLSGRALASSPIVVIETDLFRVEINLRGGTLQRLQLLNYAQSVDEPDKSFSLLDFNPPDVFLVQSGFAPIGSSTQRAEVADETTVFSTDSTHYVLGEGQDRISVPLHWRSPGGIELIKTYVFERDRYVISLNTLVKNQGSSTWSAQAYAKFTRTQVVPEGGLFRIYTYTGGILSTPEEPYEKVAFDKLAEKNLEQRYFMDDAGRWQPVTGGWIAMIQHYFTVAIIPEQQTRNYYFSRYRPESGEYDLGVFTPSRTLEPGASGDFNLTIYAGPKIQSRLENLAPHLDRTVDYGYLWFIAKPMFWVMDHIHDLVGNWGVSIILVTLLIKLAFYPLSAASYKSMAKMRKLTPRLQTLRERYGDDRQRLNTEMMKMYKEEKINPLGGCLPIFVQIPFFIALYWVLIESVELRQAPFALWLSDLSEHDPYFVLPLLMGASMFVQQMLNPPPPDPMQARVMKMLPVVFTFFFLFFPSGLVLYWLCNNLLSIAQQWVINKRLGAL